MSPHFLIVFLFFCRLCIVFVCCWGGAVLVAGAGDFFVEQKLIFVMWVGRVIRWVFTKWTGVTWFCGADCN